MADGAVLIEINPGAPGGRIRPLHGVNNGPICFGGLVDLSERFAELRIPSVRLHDCEWPNPAVVDIPTIFPDLRADPRDPGSYHFERTDDYIQSIVDVGAEIVYRLGTSIEHTRRKYHVHPPSDMRKWAEICVHVIRHYNGGWADGFDHDIRYWEIWNEANIGAMMWSGTKDDYFDLYEATARAIKEHDPGLLVGGPAAGGGPPRPFVGDFVGACAERALPLDFCSWHTYTADPHQLSETAVRVRRILDEHGYQGAENHLNEWNYAFSWGGAEETASTFEALQGPAGASFTAYALMLFQDSPIDLANYYTGDTSWWGLFDPYGVPRKPFYAFKAFAMLLETPNRITCRVEGAQGDVMGVAGISDDGRVLQLLLSNRSPAGRACTLRVGDRFVETEDARLFVLDDERDLSTDRLAFASGTASLELAGQQVALVRLAPGASA